MVLRGNRAEYFVLASWPTGSIADSRSYVFDWGLQKKFGKGLGVQASARPILRQAHTAPPLARVYVQVSSGRLASALQEGLRLPYQTPYAEESDVGNF